MAATAKKKRKRQQHPTQQVRRLAAPSPAAARAASAPPNRIERLTATPIASFPGAIPLDVPELIKGGSAGFTVLLLGSAAQPIAAHQSALLGGLWLTLVGLVGFVVAGYRIGAATRLAAQGALAAVLAFTLTLPVVVYVQHQLNAWQLAVTLAFALVVGSLTSLVRGNVSRRRRFR